jgi:dTMP kinase
MALGKFITLEGVDGAGKSTHLHWLAERLRSRGLDVVVTREPGGTPLGEKLRELVLSEAMHIDTEVLLMFAARREHLAKVIFPALNAGKWVISDRFTDATYAYQGGGHGVPIQRIRQLEEWVHKDFQADLTLIFHLPLELAEARRGTRATRDKFEQQERDFFERVSDIYLSRARQNPARMHLIDASQSVQVIQKQLEAIIASI